jgi:hypothetical protein
MTSVSETADEAVVCDLAVLQFALLITSYTPFFEPQQYRLINEQVSNTVEHISIYF